MKKGSLIKMKRSGRFAAAVSDVYTYRFMDEEDHEMVAHGMGHLAGSYGSAIDIIFVDNGFKRRLRISDRNFEVVCETR